MVVLQTVQVDCVHSLLNIYHVEIFEQVIRKYLRVPIQVLCRVGIGPPVVFYRKFILEN
jgi:hypothetical protein